MRLPAISCLLLLAATSSGVAAPPASFRSIAPLPGRRDGAFPYGNLVSLNGKLYGTTAFGGSHGRGTVFSVDPAAGAETPVYAFKEGGDAVTPAGGLITANGMLYGESLSGGANGLGAVYAIEPATGTEKRLFSFTAQTGSGAAARLVAAGGKLYGITSTSLFVSRGALFSVDMQSGDGRLLYAFTAEDGGVPASGMVFKDNTLYGATALGGTYGKGTLFAYDVKAKTKTTLYSFDGGAHGGFPAGGVIEAGGVLYGATPSGSIGTYGTVFAYDLTHSQESTLYTFTGMTDGAFPQGPLVYADGTLYGATAGGGDAGAPAGNGTIFAVDTRSGASRTLYTFKGGTDGGHSSAAVIDGAGTLYGTSYYGSGLNAGAVFGIALPQDKTTILHSFTYGAGPANGTLSEVGGKLYGTASGTGSDDEFGAIYAFDPVSGKQTTLTRFTGGKDGGFPAGGMTDIGGRLYGVAQGGGANGTGGIFVFDPATAALSLVLPFPASFAVTSGALVRLHDRIYGTTAFGGAEGYGAVFGYDLATGDFALVHSFMSGADGAFPLAGLLQSGGLLYGVASSGGASGGSVLFSLDPATKILTPLHGFGDGGSDGTEPASAPVLLNGTLYGTTNYGGTPSCVTGIVPSPAGCGVLYSYAPASGAFAVAHSFAIRDGVIPNGPLTEAGGTLYGSAAIGGTAANAGTLFGYTPAADLFAVIHRFSSNADGGGGASGLAGAGGLLYGVTADGGPTNAGIIFSLGPD